jgi:holo-[acyl-carrier protein] synthase
LPAIGLDIVSVSRIEQALRRYGDRFLKRILGPSEQQLLSHRKDRERFVAGRFAAKEAIIKALDGYLDFRPRWSELEIVNTESGRPRVILPEKVQIKLGMARPCVSITHERQFAAAVAVIAEDL